MAKKVIFLYTGYEFLPILLISLLSFHHERIAYKCVATLTTVLVVWLLLFLECIALVGM